MAPLENDLTTAGRRECDWQRLTSSDLSIIRDIPPTNLLSPLSSSSFECVSLSDRNHSFSNVNFGAELSAAALFIYQAACILFFFFWFSRARRATFIVGALLRSFDDDAASIRHVGLSAFGGGGGGTLAVLIG